VRDVLITVERVALLRRVGLFSGTPERALAGLAQVVEEVEVPAGETVMREGAVEDWLYVVVDGELEVVRADRRATIPAGGVVGELAVLDPMPRSATVRAVTDTLLFRLDKASFDEAVELRPEIARGVILELVARLRETHDRPASP
jgi:CRP/FNR family transcriptional regulator, cyclic AMP receptor protein